MRGEAARCSIPAQMCCHGAPGDLYTWAPDAETASFQDPARVRSCAPRRRRAASCGSSWRRSTAPIRPRSRIAIAAGSRGIDNLAVLVKEVGAYLKERGAEPFVVPAMGSHGGATADGQADILKLYGISRGGDRRTGALVDGRRGIAARRPVRSRSSWIVTPTSLTA